MTMIEAYVIMCNYNDDIYPFCIYPTIERAKEHLIKLAENFEHPQWTNSYKLCFTADECTYYIEPSIYNE